MMDQILSSPIAKQVSELKTEGYLTSDWIPLFYIRGLGRIIEIALDLLLVLNVGRYYNLL